MHAAGTEERENRRLSLELKNRNVLLEYNIDSVHLELEELQKSETNMVRLEVARSVKTVSIFAK